MFMAMLLSALAFMISQTNLSKAAQCSLLGLFGVSSVIGIFQQVMTRIPNGLAKEERRITS
jgi:hypothetical protein